VWGVSVLKQAGIPLTSIPEVSVANLFRDILVEVSRLFFFSSFKLFSEQHLIRATTAAVGLQPEHYSSLTVPNLQPTANQERNDQCGNQHHSREFLMMDIVVPETC